MKRRRQGGATRWVQASMTPKALRRRIRHLPEAGPLSDALTVRLLRGKSPKDRCYRYDQKEHWLGWLGDYDRNRTAEFAYNHIRCAPMLLWLAEASRMPKAVLRRAFKGAVSARSGSSACVSLRKVIPWSKIAARLRTGTLKTASQ
jgi:hypothetical protein